MEHELLTVGAFINSYDRDVMHLHDNPEDYINAVEAELSATYPHSYGYNKEGTKVWAISLMKAHLHIQGDPQWSEVSPRP